MNTIIIGLGNPVLTDDSVGLKIAEALRERLAGRPGVTTVELYSGGLRLVEAMAGFDRAIVLDAMVSGRPAGIRPYCSGVCCEYAFKFNHLIGKKLQQATVYHFYRELAIAGKDNFTLYRHARENPNSSFIRYAGALRIFPRQGKAVVEFEDGEGKRGSLNADMVVLCPAITGADGSGALSEILDIPRDGFGFFAELDGRLDSVQSKIKGIYIAGACQAPMDIQQAISQGLAAAGSVLSGLAEGRKLEIEPITASVEDQRCAKCRTCALVCPYKAISYPPERGGAYVNALLCHGCGTCVAACPAGAIRGNHFTSEQIRAELEAVLQ